MFLTRGNVVLFVVLHGCHYDEHCPPCTILVSKWCMGSHKVYCVMIYFICVFELSLNVDD